MENISIPISNGKKVAATIHWPKKITNKLAILCPGFLDSKDYTHLVRLAQRLQKQEYTAVRFDPIGTWESEGEIADYTMTNYLDAIESVKNHLVSKHPYSFILIGGHSRGGRMAIIYAAQDKDISAVAAIMPSAETLAQDNGNKKIKISRRDLPNNPTAYREYAVPVNILQKGKNYSAIKAAPNIHIPALFIAGENDKLIPVKEVKSIYEKIKSQKKLIVIPKIGHDFRHNENEIEIVNDVIIDWLKAKLDKSLS